MTDNSFSVHSAEFVQWIGSLIEELPPMLVKSTERNNSLRSAIMKQVISQFLTDDERAEFFGLPEGCRIREGAKIISPEKLEIGSYCWIGENAILDASGGLSIGSHTSIGLSVFVWSHSSHLTNLSGHNEIGSSLIQRKKTKIGSGCFIAGPSVILPGVTIGDNVLVRPFSVIERDVPSRSLVSNNETKEGLFDQERVERMIRKHLEVKKE